MSADRTVIDQLRDILDKHAEGPEALAAYLSEKLDKARRRGVDGEAAGSVNVCGVGMDHFKVVVDGALARGDDSVAIGRSTEQLGEDDAADGVKGGDLGINLGDVAHDEPPVELAFFEAMLRLVGEPQRVTSLSYEARFRDRSVIYTVALLPGCAPTNPTDTEEAR